MTFKSLLLAAAGCAGLALLPSPASAQQTPPMAPEAALEIPYVIAAMGYNPDYTNFQSNAISVLTNLTADPATAWQARSTSDLNAALQYYHFLLKDGVPSDLLKTWTFGDMYNTAIVRIAAHTGRDVPSLAALNYQELLALKGGIVRRPAKPLPSLGYIGGLTIGTAVPPGYCIADIASSADVWPEYTYIYDPLTSGGANYFRLNHWDNVGAWARTPAGDLEEGHGYTTLSARIARIESGTCLSDIKFITGGSAQVPKAPTQAEGDNDYVSVVAFNTGGWSKGSDRVVRQSGWNVIFKQKFSPLTSTRIVTGITLHQQGSAPGDPDICDPNYRSITSNKTSWVTTNYTLPASTTISCLGGWNEQNTSGTPYVLKAHYTDYASIEDQIPRRTVVAIDGSWRRIGSNNDAISVETSRGVTKGTEIARGSEVSNTISAALSVSATVGTGEASPVKAEGTVSVSVGYEHSTTMTESILQSMETSRTKTTAPTCQQGGNIWQWVSTVDFAGSETDLEAYVDDFRCSALRVSPTPADLRNPNWDPPKT